MRMETGTGAVPVPAERVSVRAPYCVDVPYSIHQPVGRPFGSTEPPSVAAEGPSAPAAAVTTSGAPRVVSTASAPRLVPLPFEATRR